jgi:hypothetical protein
MSIGNSNNGGKSNVKVGTIMQGGGAGGGGINDQKMSIGNAE